MTKPTHQQQIRLLFILEILNCLCYFAPLTFIAIFLHNVKHLDKVEIGIAMMVGIWASRCSRIILAPLFDKIRIHKLISCLQMFGAFGYILLTQHTSYLYVSIFLISICYGNTSMLIRVLIHQIDDSSPLNKRFTLLHVATNIAALFGPILFNLIAYQANLAWALHATAIGLICTAVFCYFSLSDKTIPKQQQYFSSLKSLLMQHNLLKIYVLIIFAYFFYAQIFSLAPIFLANRDGLSSSIWIIGFLNSLIAILCSVKINDFLHQHASIYAQISCGFILALIGFSLLLFVNNPLGIVMGVIFISLAEIAFIPGFQVILSEKTTTHQKVAVFAINALCMGIGEGIGQYYGIYTGLSQVDCTHTCIVYGVIILGLYLSFTLHQYDESSN